MNPLSHRALSLYPPVLCFKPKPSPESLPVTIAGGLYHILDKPLYTRCIHYIEGRIFVPVINFEIVNFYRSIFDFRDGRGVIIARAVLATGIITASSRDLYALAKKKVNSKRSLVSLLQSKLMSSSIRLYISCAINLSRISKSVIISLLLCPLSFACSRTRGILLRPSIVCI